MGRLNEILEFNKDFVKGKEYEKYSTSKTPHKKILVLSCMDTRLTELLPRALNLKNGDVKIVKNAGAQVTHNFGSVMKSIIVAIHEFKVGEVLVIGHHGCGMCNLDTKGLIKKIKERGISESTIDILKYSGHDLEEWLDGFDSVEDSIINSVEKIKHHPLVPKDISVHGLIMSPETGKVDVVINDEDIK